MDKINFRISIINLNKRLRIIKRLFIIIIVIYIFLCLFTHLFLERVILWPQKLSDEVTLTDLSRHDNNVENIELKTDDGNTLRGWLINNSNEEKSNLLIYFGGNAEELSYVIPKMSKINNWSVALINYRGYGMSEGSADEPRLYNDCLDIFDYFANREDVNKNNIVVMGRSIGTGVATYLAERRNTSAVILVSPYDTLTSVIQEKCPIIPVKLLFKHKYDSIGRAMSIKQPLLIIVGSEDRIIPTWHSRRLKEAWSGKVFYEEITGEGHNSIDDVDEYWNKIRQFLSQKDSL